ncbi:type I DNA topoisomerase [Candidatus Woesebacteria bacterium]|nr:type I DNA topoisomerase [Candidatus Woesebacteria bacterium]
MKNLIIVESPTKARTLNRFLGKDYDVQATMGHIKDLPKSKLSVDLEKNYEPDYQVVKGKSKTIKSIKDSSSKAENIFIATDPDREGEAIAAHVKEIVGNGKTKRIVFHEITKSAVEHAIANPGKVNVDLVDAQIARRVLDRLVGYKASPILWKKVRRGLSAGRVQTVAVRLIVEREREIEAFKPEEYWEIFVEVTRKGSIPKQVRASQSTKSERDDKAGIDSLPALSKKDNAVEKFTIQLVKIDGKKADIGSESQAKAAVGDLEKADYKVSEVKKRQISKNPYPPFTTSTLTQTASRFYGWSAKKTMTVAQRLYEEGLITYHRTDSTNIAKPAMDAVRKFIEVKYGSNYLPEKPRFYKTRSKLAQEAHEAIRPTDVNQEFKMTKKSFVKDGERLYDIIWKRFVACQMSKAVYDSTTIDVLAKTEKSPEYILRVSGQIMKFDGWRKVIPPRKASGQKGSPARWDEEPQLPDVEKDDELKKLKVDPQQKFTQPPARYNEASLIKTLEKMGIGRPSTYAPTISTIQSRNYVEKNEGRFFATPIGFAVSDFLVKNFENTFDYDFTAEMEDHLDEVAKGETDWHKMIDNFYKPFSKKLDDVEENAKRVAIETEKLGKKCPTCNKEGRTGDAQGELVVRTGRFGKFISCSNFPDCKHTEKYMDKIGMKCPECGNGDVIVKKTRRGRQFYGCSNYPKCEFASWKKPQKD